MLHLQMLLLCRRSHSREIVQGISIVGRGSGVCVCALVVWMQMRCISSRRKRIVLACAIVALIERMGMSWRLQRQCVVLLLLVLLFLTVLLVWMSSKMMAMWMVSRLLPNGRHALQNRSRCREVHGRVSLKEAFGWTSAGGTPRTWRRRTTAALVRSSAPRAGF